MKLLNVLKFLVNHPLTKDGKLKAVNRFVKWQIGTRFNPYPVIYPFLEDSKLIIQRGMAGATGNLYAGLHEFQDMAFLLHFLRQDDLFADIGANIGSYTVLAAGVIKSKAISMEPVPLTFRQFMQNIYINNLQDKVTALNIGVGSKKASLKFTSMLDTTNHVVSQNENAENCIEVNVESLDVTLENKCPVLMKIDTEGYEAEVIRGAEKILSNDRLKAIIIELNGAGARYGFNEKEIHRQLIEYGFSSYDYFPFEKKIKQAISFGPFNTIYIRDIEFVQQRILTARKFKIYNKYI